MKDTAVNVDPSTWPTVVGGDRPARVVAPVGSYQGGELPLVLLLHGYAATAGLQDVYFALSPDVESLGFVELMPEGTVDRDGYQFWNATPACCDLYGTGVDDVAYLSSIVHEAMEEMPIDPARVVVLGHSNGAFMAYRLACEDPGLFPAIAGLAGSTFWDAADCEATDPVATLAMHGTADDVILYDGLRGLYPGSEDTVGRMADRAGCDPDPTVTGPTDDDQAVDGDETDHVEYAGCSKPVEQWRLNGSGHIPIPSPTFHADLRDWLFEDH